jgi:hypothetical protein
MVIEFMQKAPDPETQDAVGIDRGRKPWTQGVSGATAEKMTARGRESNTGAPG